MKPRTYYDILGVSRDASLEEITAAKNALAKVYHPDANVKRRTLRRNRPMRGMWCRMRRRADQETSGFLCDQSSGRKRTGI